MTNRKKKILWALIFVVGLLIFLYPTISDLWNKRRSEDLVAEYQKEIKKTPSRDFEKEKHRVREYNKELLGEVVPHVFAVRENKRDKEYESLLNINGDGMMGYVKIPAIDVHLPIYHYTTDEVLEENVGHLVGSSLPIGGKGTHVAISAHRGLPSAKLFTDLNLLKKGDLFYLYVLDETLAYKVDQILVVKPDQTDSLAIDPQKDYVTLFTCTPYGVNDKRLMVRGHRVPTPQSGDINNTGEKVKSRTNLPYLLRQIASILLGVLVAYIVIKILEKRGQKR